MSARDEIAKIIAGSYNLDSGVFLLSFPEIADQIIATLRANGWHHDEDAIRKAGERCMDYEKESCLIDEYCVHCDDDCLVIKTLTVADVLEGK